MIVVMGSLIPPEMTDALRDVLEALSKTVFNSLQDHGAEVRFIEASGCTQPPAQILEGCQGLLVLGGADADPASYGQRPVADTIYGIDRAVDDFELGVMALAKARGLPILGICRGMQLINILHGGDLIQEVGAPTIHNGTADNSIMVGHDVELAADSHLARIYGRRHLRIRSGHHQAVDRLGAGLQIAARAADGMIEAIEGQGPAMLIGVQWHPEDPQADPQDRATLIAAFVAAARAA